MAPVAGDLGSDAAVNPSSLASILLRWRKPCGPWTFCCIAIHLPPKPPDTIALQIAGMRPAPSCTWLRLRFARKIFPQQRKRLSNADQCRFAVVCQAEGATPQSGLKQCVSLSSTPALAPVTSSGRCRCRIQSGRRKPASEDRASIPDPFCLLQRSTQTS